jgi:predicted nucleic acid-binding protein
VIRAVADASVAVKWAFPFRDEEADGEKAIALLDGFRMGQIALLQPPHWLAEVAAVISRQSAAVAREYIQALYALRIPVVGTQELYSTACELVADTGQHLFDTLYHAVALRTPEYTFITADERYYKKAHQAGSIALLRDFDLDRRQSGL